MPILVSAGDHDRARWHFGEVGRTSAVERAGGYPGDADPVLARARRDVSAKA
ncbi:hypothetical protein K8Z49_02175 [Actinomadura madurae]|uniref:hypothetical protein n=1 Tax=Actinomadura madurae TaxID=1993 RepID=UPI0015A58C60|nr:hypothetical protein [Actinomadura madurae]